jgi:rhodanese-related sulfurtransferase
MQATPRSTIVTLAARQEIALILVGGLLGVAVNGVAPWAIPWSVQPRVVASAPDSLLTSRAVVDASQAEPLSITLAQAKLLHDQQRAIFVDSRPPYEYKDGSIPGAVNIPYDEVEFYTVEIDRLPRDSTIAIYCSGGECDLSILLGDHLAARGFANIRIFFGGWTQWEAAGYEVSRPE